MSKKLPGIWSRDFLIPQYVNLSKINNTSLLYYVVLCTLLANKQYSRDRLILQLLNLSSISLTGQLCCSVLVSDLLS